MHEKQANLTKNRAPMIRYRSHKQLSLAEFDWPFQTALDENNRWVKMSQCIPWDELAEGYYQGLSTTQGRPTKDARFVGTLPGEAECVTRQLNERPRKTLGFETPAERFNACVASIG